MIPDVVWISQTRLEHGIDEAGHLTVAPELMVEVMSPGAVNEQRDKTIKLNLYSRYGVQEYWVVNWQLKTLEVYRRHEAQLQIVSTLMATDALTSPLLPGLAVSSQIFLRPEPSLRQRARGSIARPTVLARFRWCRRAGACQTNIPDRDRRIAAVGC